MHLIGLLDTAVASTNLGDQIIMDAVQKELKNLFPNDFFVNVPTHDYISEEGHKLLEQAKYKFVAGTNLLSSNMDTYNQWKIKYDETEIENAILMGVGWWQYQDEINPYTQRLLKKVLSSDYLHSVRDQYTAAKLHDAGFHNVINTGCPTLWQLTPEHCQNIPSHKATNVVMTLTDYNQNIQYDTLLIKTLFKHYENVFIWVQGRGDHPYLQTIIEDYPIEVIPPSLDAYDTLLSNMNDLDYVGTRLHAGIRAMQHKHRTIIISVDNRATEMGKNFNLNVIERNALERLDEIITSELTTNIMLPQKEIHTWKQQFIKDTMPKKTTDSSTLNKSDISKSASLNVGLISYTTNGGAGIAAQRLHQGLLDLQINSSFFLLRGVSKKLLQNHYFVDISSKQNFDFTDISRKNTFAGNTLFSLSYPSLSFKDLDAIVESNDVINLHWVARTLSTEAIAYLSNAGKPIVWTFHDINPISGGCHYFHGCENWKTDCMNCPQMIDNYDNYPAKILAAKKKYINFKNITVVVLNKHFKTLVEQSPLFNESRIEVIPNSIDTERFRPLERKETRAKLGLEANKKYLLYVADYASTIKGYKEFEQTVETYDKLYNTENIEILLVGNLPKDRNIKLAFKEFGHVNEEKIIELYSASDVTVLSSIEDNLPNVILESFSCGTPVVGFKVGGLPDLIEDAYNGYTVNLGDIKGLAKSIYNVLEGENLSKNCRVSAEKHLKLKVQAQRYKAVYDDLLKTPLAIGDKKNDIPETFPETFPETASTLTKLLNASILLKDTLLKEKQNLIDIKNKSLEETHKHIANLADIRDKQKEKLKNLSNLKSENTILLEQLDLIKNSKKKWLEEKNKNIADLANIRDKQKEKMTNLEIENMILKKQLSMIEGENLYLNKLQDERWCRSGKLSRKRKLWAIGKIISKKLKIYELLQPTAKYIKKILGKSK